ncbi:MAG: TetR/AcrR family transcriptional regulator [Bacteroidales bacterium]|nr:TetR/AcrR family transcriptional regulator [Bacteroidales bacterium]
MVSELIMTVTDRNTEEIILEAACTIFFQKGFAGARMQEIADSAGINKALLHYYYRSKDQLFEAVFNRALISFLPTIKIALEAEMPLTQKIAKFVENYVDVLIANPHIPAFVIHELNTDPNRVVLKLKSHGVDPRIILRQVDEAIAAGEIRAINGEHFLINLLSLCIFPFVARPVAQGILQKSNEEYTLFLQQRKSEILEFVMQSIKAS